MAIETNSNDDLSCKDLLELVVSKEERTNNFKKAQLYVIAKMRGTCRKFYLVVDTYRTLARTEFGKKFLENYAIHQVSLTTAMLAKCAQTLTVPGSPTYFALQVIKTSSSIVSSGSYFQIVRETIDFPPASQIIINKLGPYLLALNTLNKEYQKKNPTGPGSTAPFSLYSKQNNGCLLHDKAELDRVLMSYLFI